MQPKSFIIALLFLACYSGSAQADLSRCIDATCRVTAEDGSIGTGVVFEIGKVHVYVLTNAHIATGKVMLLEFWRRGHISQKIAGSTVLRSKSTDVAIIAVDARVFGRRLPGIVPLASPDYILKPRQTVFSVGCANGRWATAWKGNIIGYDASVNKDVMFNPTPADGRSGSAIFDEYGTKIVALLHARVTSKQDGQTAGLDMPTANRNYGLAVNLQRIWTAIDRNGKRIRSEFSVNDREVMWPPPVLAQRRPWIVGPRIVGPRVGDCGPRGCPTGPILPYRRYQQERDRRQDKQIERLYPTLPEREVTPPPAMEVPPLDVPIDQPSIHESAPPPPPPKRSVPVGWAIASVLLCAFAGAGAGLAVQWNKTYQKQ